MDKNICAFTGHRPKSFPWKYDETVPGCILLKEALFAQIKALADRGITDFLSGMAQGVDLWSARAVLALRAKDPAVKLHCILPCEGQENKWPASMKEQYRSILSRADEVLCLQKEYSSDCMAKRNRYLVDHAAVMLAVYNGTRRSGTGMTLHYAQQQGREIFIFNPMTREITHIQPSAVLQG